MKPALKVPPLPIHGGHMVQMFVVLMLWSCLIPFVWTIPQTLNSAGPLRAGLLALLGAGAALLNTDTARRSLRWLAGTEMKEFIDFSHREQLTRAAGTCGLYFACHALTIAKYPEDFSSWYALPPGLGVLLTRMPIRSALKWLLGTLVAIFAMELYRNDLLWALRTVSVHACYVVFMLLLCVVTQRYRVEHWALGQTARELRLAKDELEAQAADLVRLAIMKERERLAREIHDAVGHSLTVVGVQLQVAEALMSRDPDGSLQAVRKARWANEEGLAEVRRSTALMISSPLEQRTLSDALMAMASAIQLPGKEILYTLHGTVPNLAPLVALTTYRAAQECLTNALRHAAADRIEIELDASQEDRLSLTVADNGSGMPEDQASGSGLRGLKDRVSFLKGEVLIQSEHGKGCRVQVSLPLAPLNDYDTTTPYTTTLG
jgi:signal transduction histidine kinase